jgi:hypothetical protein
MLVSKYCVYLVMKDAVAYLVREAGFKRQFL